MRTRLAVAGLGACLTLTVIGVAMSIGQDAPANAAIEGRDRSTAAFLSVVGINADEDMPSALSELKVADSDMILQGRIIALRPGPTRGEIKFADGVSTPLWMFAVATLRTDDGATLDILVPLADRFATPEELATSLPAGEVVLIAHRVTDEARAEYVGPMADWQAIRPWDVLVDEGGSVPIAAAAGAPATFLTPGTLDEVAEELSEELDVPAR